MKLANKSNPKKFSLLKRRFLSDTFGEAEYDAFWGNNSIVFNPVLIINTLPYKFDCYYGVSPFT